MNNKKKRKYMEFGMGIGMFAGACLGLLLGMFAMSDFNPGLGSAIGLCFGMSVGSLIGMEKDKRIEREAIIKRNQEMRKLQEKN